MAVFGIKPVKTCECMACVELRAVPLVQRAGQAAAVVLCAVLAVCVFAVAVMLTALACVAIGRLIG